MFTNIHKGIFVDKRGIDDLAYNELHSIIEQGMHWQNVDKENSGFVDHPVFDDMGFQSQSILLSNINQGNLFNIFGKCLFNHGFVLKHQYVKGACKSMSYHLDVPTYHGSETSENTHIVSVVYTMRSETCLGGSVCLSNRDDAKVLQYTLNKGKDDRHITACNQKRYSNSRDSYNFTARDNTFYAFNGSFVEHGVMPVTRGTRYSFVLFFKSHSSKISVINRWLLDNVCNCDEKDPSVCYDCCKKFKNKKILHEHMQRKHNAPTKKKRQSTLIEEEDSNPQLGTTENIVTTPKRIRKLKRETNFAYFKPDTREDKCQQVI